MQISSMENLCIQKEFAGQPAFVKMR